MDMSSWTSPPVLNGTNYPYWKARMTIFIQAIDTEAWSVVLNGWTAPSIVDGDGVSAPKPREKWTPDEKYAALANSRVLNVIASAVDESQFQVILTCNSAKKAWDALRDFHEGPLSVRFSRLQILESRFEELRMNDDETIADFNGKLRDISNRAYQLGKIYSEVQLVRKTLRSLPNKFCDKVAAITEAKDVTKMNLNELMGSLMTFEMRLNLWAEWDAKAPRI